MTTNAEKKSQNLRPLIIAGILIGIGQGGFFDGIIFHQLLQWHHMFSNVKTSQTVAGLELNTVGDGLFHVFDWLITLLGIACLWGAGKQENVPWKTEVFLGSGLIGAGLFNVIEGIIDHQILNIHHVKPGPNELLWDIGFIAVGAVLIGIGYLFIEQGKR